MSITAHLPRYPLAFLPTPLHPLTRLSAQLRDESGSPRTLPADFCIWLKRDDQTGLATGGNKTRKLEFLVADALAQGCDTLITTGAIQSNHCRQTAAAAARAGLRCELVLGGQPPSQPDGNYLLDLLFGAQAHFTARENRLNRLRELADELRAAGRRPYFITYGGSDPVGACGYAAALEELREQTTALGIAPDLIVIPSSSSGTQAGLAAGAWALGWDVPILGISIDAAEAELQGMVAELASQTAGRLGKPHIFAPADIRVSADYLGGGYGVVGDLEREAVSLMARTEGVLLDPVYTGRAFGGLLKMLNDKCGRYVIDRSMLWERVLDHDMPSFYVGKPLKTIVFWHTGGSPALFAYADQLTDPNK